MFFGTSPDWNEYYTAKDAEEELTGFKFTGPGWYIGEDGNAMLVVPDEPLELLKDGTWNFWAKKKWPVHQMFRFMMFDGNPCQSFNAAVNAPTREDKWTPATQKP